MIDTELVAAHRHRALSPERPKLRGTAQNPDVFFQAREACNPFYAKCAGIVQKHMDKFAKLVGRQYHLFDYVGAPDADRVIVVMGSGVGVVEETVDKMVADGQKVGMLIVRLYRPGIRRAFVATLPKSVKQIAVLDRTKEPGGAGEPLPRRDYGIGRVLAPKSPGKARCRRSWAAARAVVEGVHARYGRRRVRRIEQNAAETSCSSSAFSTT